MLFPAFDRPLTRFAFGGVCFLCSLDFSSPLDDSFSLGLIFTSIRMGVSFSLRPPSPSPLSPSALFFSSMKFFEASLSFIRALTSVSSPKPRKISTGFTVVLLVDMETEVVVEVVVLKIVPFEEAVVE